MPVETLHVRLTDAQQKELEATLETTHDVRVYKRWKVVALSSRGYTVRALAALFDLGQQRVRHYLHRYQRGGIAALPDAPRSGRPRKLPREYDGDPEAPAAWRRLLDRRPSTIPALETPSHVWTLGRLARSMQVFHQVTVAESTISNVLTRAHFRRGRTKLTVTAPDPEYEVKRRRIEALGKGRGRVS